MGAATLSPDPLVGTHYEFEVSVAGVAEQSSDLAGSVGVVNGEILFPWMPRTNRAHATLDCQYEVIITRRNTVPTFEIATPLRVNHRSILHTASELVDPVPRAGVPEAQRMLPTWKLGIREYLRQLVAHGDQVPPPVNIHLDDDL